MLHGIAIFKQKHVLLHAEEKVERKKYQINGKAIQNKIPNGNTSPMLRWSKYIGL